MFDDNHIDQLMKSVLDSGQEEVPVHVWDGISDGLDRIERRKKVVLWVRRAGVAAAAAAITLGVFLNMNQEQTIVPAPTDSQMIAVVEPEEETVPADGNEEVTIGSFRNLTAYVKPETKAGKSHVTAETADNGIQSDTYRAGHNAAFYISAVCNCGNDCTFQRKNEQSKTGCLYVCCGGHCADS